MSRRVAMPQESYSAMLLWQITQALNVTPLAEYRFAPPRRWLLDIYLPDQKLAIEVEGGIWRRDGGAHSRPTNILRDIEKGNELMFRGIRLLRVTTDQVKSGEALALVERALQVQP